MPRHTEPDPSGADAPTSVGRRALALAFATAAALACGCCARPYQPYGAVPNYYGGQPAYGGGGFGQPAPQPAPGYGPQPIPGGVPAGGTYIPSSPGSVPTLPAPDGGFGGAPAGGGFDDGGDFGDYDGGGFDDDFGQPGAGSGGDPYYGGDTGGFGSSPQGGGSAVPNYTDPLDNPDAFDRGSPGGTGVDNLDGPGGAFDPPPGYQDPLPEDFNSSSAAPAGGPTATAPDPFGPGGNPRRPAPVGFGAAPQGRPVAANDAFVRPASAEIPQPLSQPASHAGPQTGDRGYDAAGYTWLTGMLEHDPNGGPGGTWTLTYDLTPDPRDRFGGFMTLADPRGLLAGWENEHLVVLVRGAPDPAAGTDGRGRPRYRLTAAEPRGVYQP